MFGSKTDKQRNRDDPRKVRRANVPQLGLLDMGSIDDVDVGNIDNDDEIDEGLEAELLALTSGKLPPRPQRRPRAPNNIDDLNRMIAESMKDEDPEEDEGEDLENDPTLVAELQAIAGDDDDNVEPMEDLPSYPSRAPPPLPPRNSSSTERVPAAETKLSAVEVIEERINAYNAALASSRSIGETSKIRRYERGLKTLESLMKTAKAGKDIDEDQLPPMVAVGGKNPTPDVTPMALESFLPVEESQVVPTSLMDVPLEDEIVPDSSQTENDSSAKVEALLVERRDQYKQAALLAKRNNDTQTAISYIKIVKQFEAVIEAHKQGQPIDLSGMPPPPPDISVTSNPPSDVVNTPRAMSASQRSTPSDAPATTGEIESENPSELFNAPAAPVSTLEALEQRLKKYKSSQQEAQEQGNGSKARRLGRIVKQYEDAIKLYKAGKPVLFDDLPDPPGFAPIPRGDDAAPSQATQPTTNHQQVPKNAPQPPPPTATNHAPTQLPVNKPVQKPAENASPSAALPAVPPRQRPSPTNPGTAVRRPQALHEKQLATIQERQHLFREAALEAKKRGDMQAAKEYLRLSKGFSPMIEAAKCGLPVNIESAPVPPQLKRDDSFEVVEYEDCAPPGDRVEAFQKIEQELSEQITMCNRNAKHFSQIGDVASYNRFMKLEENTKKDRNAIQYAMKRGDELPRFHYETRTFSIIRCFTDLTDNDLELTIVRGINYSCPNPKEIDTYVKFEFPFPSETPARDRTSTVKDTNNPEYNRSFVLAINRKTRNLARVFKRGHIKLEVFAKGGFLRSDTAFGTVQVKLAPLETRCLIHDTFDIMDGRKPVGGKLEVKVRIREPLLSKQIEEVKEKWLVIDQYVVK